MSLQIISVEEHEKWDNIVKSFKQHDVYYLSGYVKAFQLQGDGEPLLIYFESGATRAINVVIKRDVTGIPSLAGSISQNTYFDISTPYGYGGFITQGDIDWDDLQNEYAEHCIDNNIICEFTRFSLASEYIKHYKGNVFSNTRNVVRDLNDSEHEIYMDYDHKVRKNIQKAKRSGLELLIDREYKRKNDFLRIYYSTMERTGAKESFFFQINFFERLWGMTENNMLFHVAYQDRIIASEMVLYGIENAYSFLGGTDSNYFEFRPNDFLKHGIICWAKEKGLKSLVLGGGYGSDDGIFKYKKSFAPSGVVDFHIGNMIYDEYMYDKLVGLRRQWADFKDDTDYFPKYRS